MKTLEITGEKREDTGKKNAKNLRRNGRVPCILYGGKEQTFFSAEEKSFKNLVYTPDLFEVRLKIEGKEVGAVMQDIQFHPVSDRILHIDFIELIEGKKITVDLPVRLTGNSAGVMEGGQLIQKMRRLRIKALAHAIPEFIEIKIDDLVIGTSIKVEDVDVENIEFIDSPNVVIVRVKAPRELKDIEPEVLDEELEEGEEGAEGIEGEEGAEGAEGVDGKPKEGDGRDGQPKAEGGGNKGGDQKGGDQKGGSGDSN
ncbi:MAG TPA: 50S ribosomal protein L25/general stress protein Ctc [Flavobacteriales bacterium]|nr:50S ribosomal protein L25/general stress protein Ctc [Flavobacteriales bacterium]HIA12968.1 50S ribosomal protein L25/general stress protein Ctc [Flavobacteriales bacterium]HIO73737.1 50S ribosomal protein L25/general stress protein Ctc [Flavobacteriales bacterium]